MAAYNDDGVFKLRWFGRQYRTMDEIAESEVNLNDLLGIDSYTMAVDNLPDPFITCCFTDQDILFIDLFYNYSMRHFHFRYDIRDKEFVGTVIDI